METTQRLYRGSGTLLCSINARVVEELGLEPGDLIRIDIIAVKPEGGKWEKIEEEY